MPGRVQASDMTYCEYVLPGETGQKSHETSSFDLIPEFEITNNMSEAKV